LFRIDRRFVNVSGVKFNKLDADDEIPEVGAEGEIPDAATSVDAAYSVDDAIKEYLETTKSETETKIEAILDNAREQAAIIVQEAKDEAEAELKRGWEKGFDEGSQEGKRKYEEMTEAKIREDDEALKRVLDELYEERERTYKGLEEEATTLAVEVVRKIINPAEEELENVYISLIKNALRQMSTDDKIVLRVSPNEYERFFSSGAATIELDSGATVKAAVLRDVSLDNGDLIIDTENVTINAGIESQLKYVQLAFERANQYEPG